MSRLDNEIVEAQARLDARNKAEQAAYQAECQKAKAAWEQRISADFPRLSAAVALQTAGDSTAFWSEFTVENRAWSISFHDGDYRLTTDRHPRTTIYKDMRNIHEVDFEDEFILSIATFRDRDRQLAKA